MAVRLSQVMSELLIQLSVVDSAELPFPVRMLDQFSLVHPQRY